MVTVSDRVTTLTNLAFRLLLYSNKAQQVQLTNVYRHARAMILYCQRWRHHPLRHEAHWAASGSG